MATNSPTSTLLNGNVVNSSLAKRPRIGESIIQTLLLLCGALSIFTTLGIVYILGTESLNFFTNTNWENTNKRLVVDMSPAGSSFEVGTSGNTLNVGDIIRVREEWMEVTAIDGSVISVLRGVEESAMAAHGAGEEIFRANRVRPWDLFQGTTWTPQLGQFGIAPLLTATLMTSFIAMLVALPIGLAASIFLSEYASERTRNILKPILEVLAGIPTVVYGYFALTFMTPLLRNIFGVERVQIFNTASAGIVVGILIIPLVTSMSEDALHAVPRALREAAFGLGATKLETSLKIVVPAALSGITAAFVVAISRAIGETMIVAIAAGAGPNFTFNPFDSAETMTGHIVRISSGDISYDSIDYNSLFAIGLILFLLTFTLNVFSRRFVARFREVYE